MTTILIVDDNPPDRELLAYLLRHARYRVLEAEEGMEALRLVRTEHPDLVISDVLLPKMDGYEFVRQLRADPSVSRTPVIFYTAAFHEQEARDLARDCGVERILSKPTDPEKILDCVAEVLKDQGNREISPPPPSFDRKHQQLLIDKLMRQVDAKEAYLSRMNTLLQASRWVLSAAASEEMLKEVVAAARGLTDAKTGSSCLGFGEKRLRVGAALKVEEALHCLPGAMFCTWEGGVCAEIVEKGKPVRLTSEELKSHPAWLGLADGQPVPLGLLAVPLMSRDGRPNGLIMVSEKRHGDFTNEDEILLGQLCAITSLGLQHIEALDEIRKSRDELEIRVRERTGELERANQDLNANAARLELMNRELQEFAFVASHDLQEPLRKIQAFGERLKSGSMDSLGESGRDYLERMTSSAKRMSSLLEALLRYSRITTRVDQLQPADLAKLARDAVSDLELAVERSGARIEILKLPVAEVDSSQMRQLFQNLIGNAIKYRRNGEIPSIKVHGRTEGGIGRFFVEDNGIGFDERYLDRIFVPFQRLHGRGEYEGTGMGLAICRKIVERHGGSITAKSTPGRGSTFIVTLPLKQTS